MKITDYLAIYAAALSTLVFLWNLRQARPRIKVTILPGLTDKGETPRFGAFIIVKNMSPLEVHLSASRLLYRHKKPSLKEKLMHILKYRQIPRNIGWVQSRFSYYDVDDEFPLSLGARKAHRIFIPESALEKIAIESGDRTIRCNIQDELGNNVLSKKFTWNKPR
ncbi:hypothetical protein G4G28_24260 [Massilia sp. Dwa41.01b]|uniref:hypothetical protein n=1 Tax=unclassified Massilia TaxID=2609279 RepID=UPI001600A313|nr:MULTISPECIES: hypothetical protein [unclassified Massilia]QNA90838.1 hypothetical protein G4G28_24260 [Massilia sp. Dwa41.01b]QNA98081.1 hypothetical protein G4G31_03360 [Massilia sp. Se16.2.3]